VHQSIFDYSLEFEKKLRRKNHSTPKNFLDFINTYSIALIKRRREIDLNVERLEGGLVKLQKAADDVAVMSKELEIKKREVDTKKAEVEAMIDDIQQKTTIAKGHEQAANIKNAELEVSEREITIEEKKASDALQEAMPAVERAKKALDVIDPKKLSEVKTYTTPPPLVRDTCVCILIFKPFKAATPSDPDPWTACKQMLGNMSLLATLKN
jgi:dynein heavy chain